MGSAGGCTADLSKDIENCGACGRACVDDDQVALPLCKGGVCRSYCESGFVNKTMPDLGPDDGCETPGRRVFVTEAVLTVLDVAGVDAADARCQQLADTAKLGGTWAAWLSDGTNASAPAQRFVKMPDAPYMLLDFTLVADSWMALLSTDHHHPIDLTEAMTSLSQSEPVWTGTDELGQPTITHCGAWTVDTDGLATVGDPLDVTAFWTAQESTVSCTGMGRLYCFEQ